MRSPPLWLVSSVLCVFFACSETSSEQPTSGGVGGEAGLGASATGGNVGGAGGIGGTGGAEGPVDPGYPDFPEVVSTLSVTIRTADVEFAGTDDGHLSLCLDVDRCFLLDTPGTSSDNEPWPNEMQQGEVDTFHFEGVALSRSDIDRVELRTATGDNAFIPACIAVRLDGEAVHCNDSLDVTIGNGSASEVTSFVDPDGLHQGCDSCYPEVIAGGPMLGAVTAESARLWVRTDATRRVTVLLSSPEAPQTRATVAYAYPDPRDDFVAEIAIPDLQPATRYRYQFDIDGRGLSEGVEFTTAPAPGGHTTRIAMGSCSRGYPAPIFSHIVAAQPDMFIHLGDNHYANANYAANDDADRLSILRWHYRRSLMQPERALLARTIPSLAVWDDHDYVGNNTIATSPGRDVALRVFGEYWANSTLGADGVLGTFSRESYGDIDIFLLDDRYYRSSSGNGSILGAAQTAWLEESLSSSTAVFKLVVSGSLFSAAGESWTKHGTTRQEFFDALADNDVQGVVLVAGDVHRSLFRLIGRDSGYALPEIVSSPLNTGNSSCSNDPDAATQDLECEDDGNFFVTLDVDTMPTDPTLTATIIDEAGVPRTSWTVQRSDLQ